MDRRFVQDRNHSSSSAFEYPAVAIGHYLRGETLIEAYWKSVEMPGQGILVGEPLAAPREGFQAVTASNPRMNFDLGHEMTRRSR